MAKRSGGFAHEINKKFKTDNGNGSLDELWGDDLDEKDIDDCFLLASQLCDQDVIACTQRNNVSIMPSSYSAFKDAGSDVATSTQAFTPSISKNGDGAQPIFMHTGFQTVQQNTTLMRTRSYENGGTAQQRLMQELTAKVKQLEERCLAKEGEASILRAQLKELKVGADRDYVKKQTEWEQKMAGTNKQLSSISSELEFKNLQIISLKQQVEAAKSDSLTRVFSQQQPMQTFKQPNPTAAKMKQRSSTWVNTKQLSEINLLHPAVFPLHCAFPSIAFGSPVEEEYLVVDQDLPHGNTLNFGSMLPVLSRLTGIDAESIDSDRQSLSCINEVVCITEQLINKLQQYLEKIDDISFIREVNSEQNNLLTDFLNISTALFDPKPWCNNEVGINIRQALAAIIAILPYSCNLQNYILDCNTSTFEDIKKNDLDKKSFLKRLTFLIQAIRKLKNCHLLFVGILNSIVNLLSELFLNWSSRLKVDSQQLQKGDNVFVNLSRELILCDCKSSSIVYKFLHLFEYALTNKLQFAVELLCTRNKNINSQCTLGLLCKQTDACIVKSSHISEEFYLKFVEFSLAVGQSKSGQFSLYENKGCDCICELVQLFIKILHKVIKQYSEESDKSLRLQRRLHEQILRKGIHLLHIFNFEASDAIVKYVATYSQYKAIVQQLHELEGVDNLDLKEIEVKTCLQLDTIEDDVTVISAEKIRKFCLWNR